ncbi:MAG: class I SAM-dependent methyltransferase, partial [Rhodospirillaceae bacterium]|nr:class I SAM-dependent methyltransferase [Rhodospirillaceae bacterium]
MKQQDKFKVVSKNLGEVHVHHRDCPLCGRNNDADVAEHELSYDVWTIKQCPDCNFVYIDRGLDYEQLFSDHSWEVTTKIEETRRENLRPVSYKASKATRLRMSILPRKKIHEMVMGFIDGGNVIDLGCGDGAMTGPYPETFSPYGVEISTELATAANERLSLSGGRCINAPTIDGLKSFPDDFFSGATLRSYLEHEMNPLGVLRELFRTLRPGGVAIVKV